jgi:hypothetical protein
MSPIFADVGPDGAVWVIDFYSFVIQHNPTPSVQSAGIQATTGSRGSLPDGERPARPGLTAASIAWCGRTARGAHPILGRRKPADSGRALDSGNQFWSLTAQRLIVDNKHDGCGCALARNGVRSATGGKGAIHALWALEGLGASTNDTHQAALRNKEAALRRNAIGPARERGRPSIVLRAAP